MWFKKTLCVLGLLIPLLPNSNASIITDALHLLPYGTNISFLATPVGEKQPIITYHTKRMMPPASTQKLLVALAAQLSLGSEYQFSTSLETTALTPNSKGVLNGDLVFRFNGDPTFTPKKLATLIEQLVEKGISTVKGNVIIDTSAYSGHTKAIGWSWNNISACYNAPVSAAIINGNCFYGEIIPANKIGELAKITLKAHYPVQVKSNVITIPKDSNNKYCELEITTKDNNLYILTGCLRQTQKKTKLAFAIQDSEVYTNHLIKKAFHDKNIQVKGNILNNAAITKPLTALAEIHSQPLSILLTSMLKESNNMIADTIFKTLGRHYYGIGTWSSGADALKEILKTKANIDLANVVLKDGSGLSRQNKITAEKMMEILQYIAQNDEKLHLIDMLPVSGKNGTLGRRTSMKNKTLNGAVIAKTGYLEGSYNLAGFMTTAAGKHIAFVQFMSGYSPETVVNHTKEHAMNFEKQVYSTLYHN